MNSMQRFKNRMTGEPVDRTPNFDIMMTFAAHYINQPLSDYYLNYKVLCDANLTVAEKFDLDIVQAISDPYREAYDLGAEIEFPYDELPKSKTYLLENPDTFSRLKQVKPENGNRMNDRLKAIDYFKEKVGGEIPIMGWVEGALAEAADLRGVNNLLMDLLERPEWVDDLLEFCCEMAINFAQAQIKAGANIIGLGDAIASQISPDMYQLYALPYEQRIFAAIKEMGATPRLHICGNTTGILNDMKFSGAEIVDLDWMVDFAQAAELYKDGPIICGNFDPVSVMLQGTPEQVYDAITQNLQQGGSRCINMAGCEIPDKTPNENLHAQTEALKDFRKG